jgi:anaerobic ribonucleoside-triphosphate reductase activating protein
MVINIHSTIQNSRVNGPGDRFVIWTQGCRKMCKGCYNPETWSHYRNDLINIEDLISSVRESGCSGVTITGGDPFEQPKELLELLIGLEELDLPRGIIVFSGYSIDEIRGDETMSKCLEYLDVLIDGRYIESERIYNGLAGSSNQNFHIFTDKISSDELNMDQEVEIHSLGELIQLTGFPLIDRNKLKEKGIQIIS